MTDRYDLLLAGNNDDVLTVLAASIPSARQSRKLGCVRLWNVDAEDLTPDILGFANEAGIDLLTLPLNLSAKRFRVAFFDMDSTLIDGECIDDMANILGRRGEIAHLTRAAMEGGLPFADSLRQRMALLAGGGADIVAQTLERMRPMPGAETFIRFLSRYDIKTYILTGGFEDMAAFVARRFGMTGYVANRLEWRHGRLTGQVSGPAGGRILDADGKRRAMEVLAQTHGASLKQCIAGGDGANDLEVIRAAGFGFAYHGKPLVMTEAPYSVRFGDFSVLMHCFEEAWES